MTVFDAIAQAREQAVAAGIVPNAVRLGDSQWQEVRRHLADEQWLDCMLFRDSAFYLHDLRVIVVPSEPDLLEAIVHLEVPA